MSFQVDASVTTLAVFVVLTAVGALITWLLTRTVTALDRTIEAQGDRIAGLEKDLAAYKLAAKDNFASGGWLKEVESRIETRLERIEDKIDGLAHQRPVRA